MLIMPTMPVDGINFNGGLEAVRDSSEPNIPIVRIEDLGVSTDKLAGDSVTNDKLADGAAPSKIWTPTFPSGFARTLERDHPARYAPETLLVRPMSW